MDQNTTKKTCNLCNKEQIKLGIDEDHAFTLLSEDIQSGKSVFVKITQGCIDHPMCRVNEAFAAQRALADLREAIGCPTHPFCFGESHPYGEV